MYQLNVLTTFNHKYSLYTSCFVVIFRVRQLKLLFSEYGGLQDGIIPQHNYLKSSSPMTLVISKKHRKGEHRGVDDIFRALTSMQKLNVSCLSALILS